MLLTSLSNRAISYDGKEIRVGDKVYQMIADQDNMPKLLELQVVEVISAAMIIVFNPMTLKYSNPIPSKTVHSNANGLINQWIETFKHNLEQIPKTLIHLQTILESDDKYMVKMPELGNIDNEREI